MINLENNVAELERLLNKEELLNDHIRTVTNPEAIYRLLLKQSDLLDKISELTESLQQKKRQ